MANTGTGESPGKSGLTSVDYDDIRSKVENNGFAVAKNIISCDIIKRMREWWLGIYNGKILHAPVIWGPYFGEPNQVLFHSSNTCLMYRAYDFLWNSPIDPLTREIGLELSRIRNVIAGTNRMNGEILSADRYGIYLTTSYYPPGQGWLAKHQDHSDGRNHWHYMLQLTHKGISYTEGGLYIFSRSGEKIDIDAMVNPGDIVFFDGTCSHGVDIVSGGTGVGRLQMFSIPTFLETPQQNDRMLEGVSFSRFLKAKLRPIKRRFTGIKSSSSEAY